MSLVRGIARHGATTLHALLVLGHRRHAVGKLQAQQGDQRHDDEQSIVHCPILTLGGLDAGVNERIQTGFLEGRIMRFFLENVCPNLVWEARRFFPFS